MQLRYGKHHIYTPDLVRPKPVMSDEHKAMAAEKPPWPVPGHCKPWLDGQTAGWTVTYGYLSPITIVGLGDGQIRVENGAQLVAETQNKHVVHQLAPGFFTISPGYTLRTEAGFGVMHLPAVDAPLGLELVTGFVETDWHTRPCFMVFHAPPAGTEIHLKYKTPIAQVAVMPYPALTTAVVMSDDELDQINADFKTYLKESDQPSLTWQAATGIRFSHLYKHRSRERLRQLRDEQ